MTGYTDEPEAAVVAELAIASVAPVPVTPGALLYSIVPQGASNLLLDLEKYLPEPRRKTGSTVLNDSASFVQYVNDHKDGATRLYALPDSGTVTAVFDDHATNLPGWGQHRAVLQVKSTREWMHWIGRDGQLMQQAGFAEHIEDGLLEIREPDGATMLEVAQSFHAHTTATFRSSDRLGNGERQFAYDEETTAAAGRTGQIVVPEVLTLGIAPYEGTDPFKLEARLRYRLNGGALTIGYKLIRPHDVMREAFNEILTDIQSETAITPMVGTPSPAR